MYLLQKGGFIKEQGQDPWQKELHWGTEEWTLIWERVRLSINLKGIFGSKVSRTLKRLATVWKSSLITVF